MTNKEFAEQDEIFKKACEKVSLPFKTLNIKIGKTKKMIEMNGRLTRQASKWRMSRGLAYKNK